MQLELLDDGVVRLERTGAVLLITINRPDARNAINLDVTRGIGTAIENLKHDDSLLVGVLTGTGPVFSAGMDLKAFAEGKPAILPDHQDWGFAGIVRHACDKPVIAAVNGPAFGGGFEIVLACDIVLAADTARFGLPEVTRGLIAGGGGLPRLAQALPPNVANRLAFTGDPLSAEEALRWGLVSEVVDADGLVPSAVALAERIAANAPLSVRSTKRLLQRLAHESTWTDETWDIIEQEFADIATTEDSAEGARAFVEKRQPRWQGR